MKIGQKLVCVKSSSYVGMGLYMAVVEGEFYTYSGEFELPGFITTKETGNWGIGAELMRPVDDTFGEVVAEIIEKQLELETA